jgi:hypothetical protein
VAAILRYDNTAGSDVHPHNLLTISCDGGEHTIPYTSCMWEPSAYPLLFPHSTLGWGLDRGGMLPNATQMWSYCWRLLHKERFRTFGRLASEYAVDMWSREIEGRLRFIRDNQRRMHREDAELMQVDHVEDDDNIYLPASFLGSNRWASERILDALAIAASLGPPTFFITMTCNPNWPEIRSMLGSRLYSDDPVLVARVFKQKLRRLLETLNTMFCNSGPLRYHIYTIEFQKRGLPHAHILIRYARDCVLPEDIDAIVSAEIPLNALDARLVRDFMIHSHPNPNSLPTYCERVDHQTGLSRCQFHFPYTLQPTTTINDEGRVQYRRCNPGDEWVVLHCLPLLRKFQCHINFEVANTSIIFQYLFKYVHKGEY